MTNLHLVLGGLDRRDLVGLLEQGRLDVVDLGRQTSDVIPDGRGHELEALQLLSDLLADALRAHHVLGDLAEVGLDAGQLDGHFLGVAVEADEQLAEVAVDVVDVVAETHQVALEVGHVGLHGFELRSV